MSVAAATFPDTAGRGPKPYQILMALVFAVALVAAYTMLPDDNEIIAMLERDGHSGDAIAILEENYKQGDRRYRMLSQLLTLYQDEGATAKARPILEDMVGQRPNDAGLRERSARFYRDIGDTQARLSALKSQIDIRYNEPACREYISALRLNGDAKAEIAALQMCRQKGYRRPEDLVRLGTLLASTGEIAPASTLLRAIDDVRRLKAPEERLLLISLLLDQQQPNEAERRAIRWIKPGNNQALALSIVDVMSAGRYSNSALAVAKAAGDRGDAISLTVAERLLERSETKAAGLYLKGWLDNAQFDSVEIFERFVAAAIEAEDPETALAGARKFGLARMPAATSGALAAALIAKGLTAPAAEVRAAAGGAPAADGQTAGPQAAPSARIGAPNEQVGVRIAGAQPENGDPLALWRKTLALRMYDDAQRRLPPSSGPIPRHTHVPAESKSHHAQKVLKKASRVLQRSKHLKSLKLKQGLARAKAGKHGTGKDGSKDAGKENQQNQ